MLTLNDGRSELWQWDTGRKLTVDADCSQVHFSNKVFGRSIDVDVANGVAIIPNILLQTDKDLTAWAFVGTAENGYTKISKVFKVNKRNKPADYVFTEQDQTTLGEILDRIEDLENRQSGDVSKEDIQDAVNEYLDNNPVSVNETDPTVPDWAKQKDKPSYTAQEVGALSAETLPAAVNEALAQAKASGAFDGAPGKDGAPGPAGPAGAPGVSGVYVGSGEMPEGYNVQIDPDGDPFDGIISPEAVEKAVEEYLEQNPPASGGGIDVTGAEVGQTIVVKAVDENGVPTEWEPADLTGGWTPIIDVTTEEAVVSVTADVDMNGNPFSVKEIMWAAKLPKDGATEMYFVVGVPCPEAWAKTDGISMPINLKNNDCVTFGTQYLVGTRLRMGVRHSGISEYSANTQPPYGGVLDGFDTGVSELTTIRVGTSNNAITMPAGSIIRVWGR